GGGGGGGAGGGGPEVRGVRGVRPGLPVPGARVVRRAGCRALEELQGAESLDRDEDPRPRRLRAGDRKRRGAGAFPGGGSGPPAGFRAPRADGALNRELPLSPEGFQSVRRGAGPDQPRDREPPRRRRVLLPRADDPARENGASSLYRHFPDAGGTPHRPSPRSRTHRETPHDSRVMTSAGGRKALPYGTRALNPAACRPCTGSRAPGWFPCTGGTPWWEGPRQAWGGGPW